jgi:hypothetical protein
MASHVEAQYCHLASSVFVLANVGIDADLEWLIPTEFHCARRHEAVGIALALSPNRERTSRSWLVEGGTMRIILFGALGVVAMAGCSSGSSTTAPAVANNVPGTNAGSSCTTIEFLDPSSGSSDCSMNPSNADSPAACPPGDVVTFTPPSLGPDDTGDRGSGIDSAAGQPPLQSNCSPGSCAPGMVQVIFSGTATCVSAPPRCPAGSFPDYWVPASAVDGIPSGDPGTASVSAGSWRCSPPCQLVIHFGTLYGGGSYCATKPASCPDGQDPTFEPNTGTWACTTNCGAAADGSFDPTPFGGVEYCIPC